MLNAWSQMPDCREPNAWDSNLSEILFGSKTDRIYQVFPRQVEASAGILIERKMAVRALLGENKFEACWQAIIQPNIKIFQL